MIVLTIAETEGIAATDEEIEAKKQELLDQTGMTDIESFKSAYGYTDEDFSYEIIYSKIVDFIYNNAVQVEASETDAATDDAADEGTGMVDDYGTDTED